MQNEVVQVKYRNKRLPANLYTRKCKAADVIKAIIFIFKVCEIIIYLVLVEPFNSVTDVYAPEQDPILRIFKSETENSRPVILTDRPVLLLLILV